MNEEPDLTLPFYVILGVLQFIVLFACWAMYGWGMVFIYVLCAEVVLSLIEDLK